MLLRNSAGISIVQALVGVSLTTIVGLALASVLSNSYQHESRISLLTEGRELRSELNEVARSANCGIIDLDSPIPVSDNSWAAKTTYKITQGLKSPFLTLKESDRYGSFKIERISIAGYLDRTDNTRKYVAMNGVSPSDFASANRIKASLQLEVSSHKGVKAPLDAPVYLSIDPTSNEITSCQIAGDTQNLEAMCLSLNGAWNQLEERCSLPCPPGMDMVSGQCLSQQDLSEPFFCAANEKCGAQSPYAW